MLKGLAITPPVLGRISIGKVVEKNGKRLPEKDDQFTLTSQVQSRDGWLLHPLNEELRNGQEEFFPAAEDQTSKAEAAPKPATPAKTSLGQKLESKSLQSGSDHSARAH